MAMPIQLERYRQVPSRGHIEYRTAARDKKKKEKNTTLLGVPKGVFCWLSSVGDSPPKPPRWPQVFQGYSQRESDLSYRVKSLLKVVVSQIVRDSRSGILKIKKRKKTCLGGPKYLFYTDREDGRGTSPH